MVYIKPDVVANFSSGLVSRVGPSIGNVITSEVNALFRTSPCWNGKSLAESTDMFCQNLGLQVLSS